ncbi:MAG: FmdB family zinc ribbon protein [Bacteroidota bacterium]
MPLYDYQCYSCGLLFEKVVRVENREQKQKCSCGEMAEFVASESSYQFHTDLKPGLTPQNTGVSQLDREADRIIGRDSEKSWAIINRRTQAKEEIMEAYGLNSKLALARTPDGDYEPMTSPELRAVSAARNLHNKATSIIYSVDKETREKKSIEVEVK